MKKILFDLDGTLLDTTEMNMRPLYDLLHQHTALNLSYMEVCARYLGRPGREVLKEAGIVNIEEMYQIWVDMVNQYPIQAVMYPGVEDMLKKVKEKYQIAIVTSKTKQQYEKDMPEHLKGLFEEGVFYEDTLHHKPHPQPLWKMIEKDHYPSNEYMYIGDHINDYLCAKQANMLFGYAMWGSQSKFHDQDMVCFECPEDLVRYLLFTQRIPN